jgi:hypothetical protein
MFFICSTRAKRCFGGESADMEQPMEHDLRMREAARAIYDACYPSEDWAPMGFDDAEKYRTVHYRQAVGAAQQALAVLGDRAAQPQLFGGQ